MAELADLLNATDLQKFASSDQAWWLAAAGRAIRSFCGWHIAPSVAVLGARIRCGEQGIICLPSLYVTAVSNLTVDGNLLVRDQDYYWEPPDQANRASNGAIIHRVARGYWRSSAYPRNPFCTVDFTHGYPDVPEDVAAVGYELTQQGRSRPGANAKDLTAGPFRAAFLKTGNSLDPDQKQRLWEAGVVRGGFA